ncbi:DUF397 domain-containing protein [Streptomyces sp. NPDC046909]|uniref:DUF397 domain-containing protein n=1 Tax=Streptomyces sp. NPDC046909 TaxID=3155617 RepID=UPI0034088521
MTADLKWFKSSYSGSQGGDCLEVALEWRKSTYSGDAGGECLEVALEETGPTVHVRDSKAKSGPTLALSSDAWTAFVNSTTRTAVE